MAASLSFKVYLEAGGSQQEVRRFAVTQPPQVDLAKLRAKIVAVFPHLDDRDHELMWEDAEGDRVSIDSEEELRLALRDMGGAGVYRLYVRLVESHWWSQGGRGKKEAALNSQGEEHPGVVCCCCHLQVKGFRYKCTVCPNYDMCGGCEDKAMHPAHDMVRIPTPRSYPPHFFTRLHRLYERCTHSSPTLVKPATPLSSPNEQMARDLVDEDSSDLSDMELEVSLVSSEMSAILTSRTRNRSDSGTPNRSIGRSRLDSSASAGRTSSTPTGRARIDASPLSRTEVQREHHNQLEQLPSFEELTRSMKDLAEKDVDTEDVTDNKHRSDAGDNKLCSDVGDLIQCDNKNVITKSDEEEKRDSLKERDDEEMKRKEDDIKEKNANERVADAKDERTGDNGAEVSGFVPVTEVSALHKLQISRGAFTSLREQDPFGRKAEEEAEKELEEVKEVDTSESLRNLQQEIESLLAPLSPLPDLETVDRIQKIRLIPDLETVDRMQKIRLAVNNNNESIAVVNDKDNDDKDAMIILNNNKESIKDIKENENSGKMMSNEDAANSDDWNIVDKDKIDLINLADDDKDSTMKEETDNESSTTENEDQVDNDSSIEEEELPKDADSYIHEETDSNIHEETDTIIIPDSDENVEDMNEGENPSKWAVRLDKEIKDLENSAIASSRYISKNIERVGINTRLEDSLKNIENSLKSRSTKFSYSGSASDGDSPSFSRSSSNSSNTSSLPSPQDRYVPPHRFLASHHAQSGASVSLSRGYSSSDSVVPSNYGVVPPNKSHVNIKSHASIANIDTDPARTYAQGDNGGRHLIGSEKVLVGSSRHYSGSDNNSSSGGAGRHYNPRVADTLADALDPSGAARHYNPRVADALDKMLAMGFTDDDGWLTQLLVMKHGDISQVLDILTPVQQQK